MSDELTDDDALPTCACVGDAHDQTCPYYEPPVEAEEPATEPDAADPSSFEPPADLRARVLAQLTRHPDVPLYSEHGIALLEFDCWRCARHDHAAEDLVEIYRVRGLKLMCLACQHPDHFKWRRDPDNGHEFLLPLDVKPRSTRIGDIEAAALETAHHELVEKQNRRTFLLDLQERVAFELAGVDGRIAELQLELPALQAALVAAQTDPQREVRQRLADLKGQLSRLEIRARKGGVA